MIYTQIMQVVVVVQDAREGRDINDDVNGIEAEYYPMYGTESVRNRYGMRLCKRNEILFALCDKAASSKRSMGMRRK